MSANTIHAVIFDLDGLLADTECLHCRAYQMALLEHGVQLRDWDYAEHWVRYGKGIADWIAMRGLELDPHALRLRKAQHYLDLLRSSLRPMEGALDLLELLHGRTKLALASSSYRDAIDGVLAGLGIRHFFKVIVSGLDVAHVKPAPDIFLKAARDLGVEPERCVVLEDAEKGVIAARLAGMRCIAVPNDYTRHHDFSQATTICSSLKEITDEFLTRLETAAVSAELVTSPSRPA
ncbi:MAG TPA: HAD family phosphatase [Candidatus Binatia bacterium]|nr:HAD family phosphatase [Candidatus Binatia bacterium]